MNLASQYNSLYWQCACLNVNSGNSVTNLNDDSEDNSEEIEESELEVEDTKTIKRVAPNYGKIAKAISDSQFNGVNIELPDINTAGAIFTPNIEDNSVVYSLTTVNCVNPELYNTIVANRPYTSVVDFYERVSPTQSQMIGIIKAGCFDILYQHKYPGKPINRKMIMNEFLNYITDKEYPIKPKLTSVHLNKALDMGMNLDRYMTEIRLYKFKKYIDKNCFDSTSRRYILDDESTIKFFNSVVAPLLKINESEYGYLPENKIFVKYSSFDKVYKKSMEKLMDYLNSDDGKQTYKKFEQDTAIKELQNKYCQGSIAAWEMETMSFYHQPHELIGVNNSSYNIQNFENLPEIPQVFVINGKNVVDKCCIAGTVTDSDNNKHIVSLLTIYGMVNVKLFDSMYTQFNKKISIVDAVTKKKTVVDDSWFTRGTKLIIHGYRRENMFIAQPDYSSGGMKCVGLIENVDNEGKINIRYKRRDKLGV